MQGRLPIMDNATRKHIVINTFLHASWMADHAEQARSPQSALQHVDLIGKTQTRTDAW